MLGFFYKTDRVPIDSWQLWEHHKHEGDRSTSKNYLSTSRCKLFIVDEKSFYFTYLLLFSARSHSSSRSSSSSSCSSSSSPCSSCHHSRRRRLASIASIPAIQQQQQQQQQNFIEPDPQSFSVNTVPTTTTSSVSIQQAAQATVDPYAPAPNLIRVERIKDVNSGQDVFIRWVSDANPSSMINDEQQQQMSAPQQVYSTQPPRSYHQYHQNQQFDQDLPNELERLAFEDEHLRKSFLYNDRPPSTSSNYDYRKYKKRQKHRDLDNQQPEYKIVDGFFEDRHGQRRSVKFDRPQASTVKEYRHLPKDIVNSSAPSIHRRRRRYRATSFIQPPVQEQQQQPTFPTPTFPLTNPQLSRPFGTSYLPRGAPFFPQQTFHTTPLFSRPNFMNRMPLSHSPYWYRPM